ncbi:MAG TPA: hypothetical protein DIC60_04360 [Lachnospiraceae bacterium]|nr:hypothetical protein [Lachnospiraceae bacterium]
MLFSISNLSFGWLNFSIGNYDIGVSQLQAALFINDLIKNLLSIIKLEKLTTFTYGGNETSSFSIAFMQKQENYSFAFF